ncbi:hypothetical protein Cantr_07294 [Candida viswanathii]|uniref:Uncharacterized protein n=1 Tax=Candida viswanathii TaxID=5486 RepID=A0A367Y1G7_9ASCO|nr:hypothetical protein Cantr_07294 [Candida viswanathii]
MASLLHGGFERLESIKPAVKIPQPGNRLDIIFHNAGVMECPEDKKTKQGYQMELGTNCLGPQLLQNLLDPIFLKTAEKTPRAIQNRLGEFECSYVCSIGRVHLSDPEFKESPVSLKTKYAQSKAINLIQARQWNFNHPDPKPLVSPCVLDT